MRPAEKGLSRYFQADAIDRSCSCQSVIVVSPLSRFFMNSISQSAGSLVQSRSKIPQSGGASASGWCAGFPYCCMSLVSTRSFTVAALKVLGRGSCRALAVTERRQSMFAPEGNGMTFQE